MKFRWGHICRNATFDALVTDIEELVDHLVAAPARMFRMPDVCLAFRIDASTADGADGHVLQCVLTDDKDQPLCDPYERPFPFSVIGPGYPLLGRGILRLAGWQLPGPGAYSFDIAVDGNVVARLPLTLHPKGGGILRPKIRDPRPIRLQFAHLVEAIVPVSNSVSLRGVVEYVPLPPGAEGVNFATLALVLQIEADMAIEPNHRLRVEMVDGNGRPAKVLDSAMQSIIPVVEREITLRGVGPMMRSLAPVRFGDFLVQPEDYQFKFFLDDVPLGDPLDLSVLTHQSAAP